VINPWKRRDVVFVLCEEGILFLGRLHTPILTTHNTHMTHTTHNTHDTYNTSDILRAAKLFYDLLSYSTRAGGNNDTFCN